MNLRKLGGVTAFASALVLTVAMVGFSQGPRGGGGQQGPPPDGGFHGGPGGPHGGGPFGPFGRDLNLTDEQKAQIKKLTDSVEESTKALRDQLRTLHESQPDPASGAAFDEAAVRAAATARANIQIELEVAHARVMSQVFNLLTTEQKAKLAAQRQQFEQKRQEWESQHKDDSKQ